MSFQWGRVVVWIGLFAAGIGLGLLWSSRPIPHSPARPLLTPWIGLPQTGMNASYQPIRDALIRASSYAEDGTRTHGDVYRSLAWACSSDSDAAETYVALIGPSFFSPDQQGLRVKFVVQGDEVDVAIQDSGPLGIPPPPPPPGAKSYSEIELPAPKRLSLAKYSLQPVADAWRDQDLWQAEQKPIGVCTDERTIILEACVHGRYAVRDRGCDAPASWKVEKLQDALHRVLPPPGKAASPAISLGSSQ